MVMLCELTWSSGNEVGMQSNIDVAGMENKSVEETMRFLEGSLFPFATC